MIPSPRKPRKQRGAALIVALIFVLLIFALLLAALSESQARVRATGFEAAKLQAYTTAEMGLHAALARLKNAQDPNFNGSEARLLAEPPDASGAELSLFDEPPFQPDGAAVPDLFDELTARRIAFADEPRGQLIVRARELEPGSKTLRLRSMAAADGVVRVLDAIATPTGGPNIFAAGIGFYAADTLTIGGKVFFDSYDSSISTSHKPGLKQVVINGGAVVDANGTPVQRTYDRGNVVIGANSLVTVNGNAQEVYGQLQFGPLGSASVSSAFVAPIKGPEIDLPVVPFQVPSINDNGAFPGLASRLDSRGNLSLSGGPSVNATIGADNSASVIVINDADIKRDLIVRGEVTLYIRNLNINGNGQLRLAPGASLKVFAAGDLAIAGQGLLNGSARPENLQIYAAGSRVDVSGGAELYGVIYAPRSAISFAGNTEVFGAVIGETIRVQGTHDFHFDENLARTVTIPAGDPTDYELSAIVEVGSPSG